MCVCVYVYTSVSFIFWRFEMLADNFKCFSFVSSSKSTDPKSTFSRKSLYLLKVRPIDRFRRLQFPVKCHLLKLSLFLCVWQYPSAELRGLYFKKMKKKNPIRITHVFFNLSSIQHVYVIITPFRRYSFRNECSTY